MHWTDHAILLSVSKQGESGALVRLLAREQGLHGGLARGAFGKKHRGVYMPGNQVEARWSARLAEHLGNLQCELVYPVAALLLDDPLRLAALNAACALLCATLAEREPHPALYDALLTYETLLLDPRATPGHLHALFALFELFLLKELGYALDLSSCAATAATENLAYISPKTGRAVSRESGAPYHGKLLPLPGFFLNSSPLEGERARRKPSRGGYPPSYISPARAMRKKLTEAEYILWNILSGKKLEGFKFRRQQPLGNYIVDFVNFEKRLVVEMDGSQHTDPEAQVYDTARTAFLESVGYKVLRIWNSDLLQNPGGTVDAILDALQVSTPHGSPASASALVSPAPPQGGSYSVSSSSMENDTDYFHPSSFFASLPPPPAECVDAVKVSGYFLEAWVFQPLSRNFPAARQRFLQMFHSQHLEPST